MRHPPKEVNKRQSLAEIHIKSTGEARIDGQPGEQHWGSADEKQFRARRVRPLENEPEGNPTRLKTSGEVIVLSRLSRSPLPSQTPEGLCLFLVAPYQQGYRRGERRNEG